MKKIIIIFISVLTSISCGKISTDNEIHENLQKNYNTVYKIEYCRYICIDSSKRIFDIILKSDGLIWSKVEIK